MNLRDETRTSQVNSHGIVSLLSICLLGNFVSGHHVDNIAMAYKHGVLEALIGFILKLFPGGTSISSGGSITLSLLKLDQHSKEGLVDASSVPSVVQVMNRMANIGDLQEWGCSTLLYILCGWPSLLLKPDAATSNEMAMGQTFVSAGAVGSVTSALRNHKSHGGVNREAIGFLYHLAKDSPATGEHLINEGLVQILGDILQTKRFFKGQPDVHSAAQGALLMVLVKD